MQIRQLRTSLPYLLPLAVVLGVFLFAAATSSVTPPLPRGLAATYTQGKLAMHIPYHGEHRGTGRLVIEIVDPEGQVLGKTERAATIGDGDGAWDATVSPDKPIQFADIVWQRVRYRFAYGEDADKSQPALEGVASISEIVRRPVVHVLGQSEYLAGSRAAIRVMVSDANSGDPLTGSLRIELARGDRSSDLLYSGALNRRGTVEADFMLPAGVTGSQQLHFVAETAIGSVNYAQPIQLEEKASILLTTEKPIYQPSQTIHIRALALDRGDMQAQGERPLTFEIEDSKGNKVFRKPTRTDKFGVASAEFSLADEVNLGTYHVRALMGDAKDDTEPDSKGSESNAEIALNVQRYVLPKFKVAVDFTEKDGRPKRDFRPGDHVTGTVRANYFFGKPVDHASVTIKASGMDVAVFEAASAEGKTDGDGAYKFDLTLPQYFAGKPLSQGAARALVEATVKDGAEHSETRGEPITISETALLVTAVPEGGQLVPHIENQVFLLSSYPDGTPAATALTVHVPNGADQRATTDAGGVAMIQLNPGDGLDSLQIEADDHKGNKASVKAPLATRSGADQVLLRANKAIYKAGDRMELKVLSTRSHGPAYVDVVKNGQTILTRDVDLDNGHAELTLTATPEMAGTLDMDAYVFGRDAQPVADHRLVFVQPADELKIETTADAAVYKPGGEATVRFHVTNAKGEGVSAALGVQVVDEAVFALAEKQPGFAKVFFYLEQEVMKPRYEIHSLSMNDIVSPIRPAEEEHRDVAAQALFSATEMTRPAGVNVEFGRTLPEDKRSEYQERYFAAFTQQVRLLAERMSLAMANHQAGPDLLREFPGLTLKDGTSARDAWGTPLHVEQVTWWRGKDHYYTVRSAGPDRQLYTGDDMTVYLEEREGAVASRDGVEGSGRPGGIELKLEHDRGAANGRAEATGTVLDQSGAVIPHAEISLDDLASGQIRKAHADAQGQFSLAGLPAGRYRATVTALGFAATSRDFTLAAQDRAVLSVVLAVGSEMETVSVQSDALMVAEAPPARPMMRGGVANAAGMMAFAAAPVQQMEMRSRSFTVAKESSAGTADEPAAHVRSYFPEALYINPEIVTDGHGDASVTIPIADSITTWRMAMLASTKAGALGTGTSSLKVFQDFFVDLDLPVTLTQGDKVSIPVAIYNYAGKTGDVHLQLQPADWYGLDNDDAEKSVTVESGRVGGSQFTIDAKKIGKFKLTLTAEMRGATGKNTRQDIVVREIDVVPNGREQNAVFNGRLESDAQHEIAFPADAIADASSVLVRLYPGPLSQVIEGMDSILTMPGGCFEQTSSSTYPNVLALDYMKRTKKLTPEVHAKAEGYIANGYQRLLTFEVPGGGFSWFGQAPANKILTAYGLMEFNDMSKVSDVDPKVIKRTGDWLASQQQPDGSWKPDTQFINEGATNRYNTDVLRITAYIAWSLANTGYQGGAVEKSKQYVEAHTGANVDVYTLAVIANFAADYGKDREFTRKAMEALIAAKTEKDGQISWNAEETGVYGRGESAAVETTGLAAQALLKWGQASETVRKALTFLTAKKGPRGAWGSTQATIMALRALLLASERSGSETYGTVTVMLDGKTAETLKLAADNNDLLHQFVFKSVDAAKPAQVELKFEGKGSLAYQVVGRYFTPWEQKTLVDALSIDVAYDRTRLAENDVVTATATVHNNLRKTANMVMVDLGIPPGFDLLSEDLQDFQEKSAAAKGGRLEKFSQTATQAILYFDGLAPEQTVTLKFRLRAKYPIRARTFASRVYEYYDPSVSATAKPVQLEVAKAGARN